MRKEIPKLQFAYNNDDSGLLSIDFIIGLSIFLIAFMMVATMASGLLVGLQSKHVDYDAVAYRTAVMLTEDPGEPVQIVDFSAYKGNESTLDWEFVKSGETEYVDRFGLAVSKSTPRVISLKKFNSINASFFSREDYEKKLLFSNYPYNFNVTIQKRDLNIPLTIGDPYIENQQCGYIRRVFLVKEPNPIIVNLSTCPFSPGGEPNLTLNVYTANLLYNSSGSTYRLDPYREDIKVRLEPIDSIAIGDSVSLTDVSCTISDFNGTKRIPYRIDDISFRTKVDGYYNITPHNGVDDLNYAPTPPIDGIRTSIEFEINALQDGSASGIDNPKILITCRFDPTTVDEMTPNIVIDDGDYPGPNFVPGWMEVRVW